MPFKHERKCQNISGWNGRASLKEESHWMKRRRRKRRKTTGKEVSLYKRVAALMSGRNKEVKPVHPEDQDSLSRLIPTAVNTQNPFSHWKTTYVNDLVILSEYWVLNGVIIPAFYNLYGAQYICTPSLSPLSFKICPSDWFNMKFWA